MLVTRLPASLRAGLGDRVCVHRGCVCACLWDDEVDLTRSRIQYLKLVPIKPERKAEPATVPYDCRRCLCREGCPGAPTMRGQGQHGGHAFLRGPGPSRTPHPHSEPGTRAMDGQRQVQVRKSH